MNYVNETRRQLTEAFAGRNRHPMGRKAGRYAVRHAIRAHLGWLEAAGMTDYYRMQSGFDPVEYTKRQHMKGFQS